MHILVMTASWQSALACIQSFGRRGHRITLIDPGERPVNSQSMYVSNVILQSLSNLPFEEACVALIA